VVTYATESELCRTCRKLLDNKKIIRNRIKNQLPLTPIRIPNRFISLIDVGRRSIRL
jgi:hypothetical protein